MNMWSQITLLHQNTYGNALIKSYISGLLLLCQLMHQYSHCVTVFLIILKTALALSVMLSMVIFQTL